MRVTKLLWAAVLGIAVGLVEAKPAEAIQVLCEVSGDTGEHIVCPFYMVRESQSVALPVAMQATIKYTETIELSYFTDGEFCGNTTCVPYQLPTPFTTLKTGHTVTPSPPAMSSWLNQGQLLIAQPTDPTKALTEAYYQGQTLVGQPKLFAMHFFPKIPVAPDQPVIVSIDNILVSNKDGQPLKASVEGYPGMIVLGNSPITCGNLGQPCDDNNVCTLNDECIAGVCYGAYADCDDGDPCTDDYCDPIEGCKNSESDCVCAVSGLAGNTYDCQIRLARKPNTMPEPSALQLDLSFESSIGTLENFRDGDFCGSGGCV